MLCLFWRDNSCQVMSLSLSQPLSPFHCIFSLFAFEELSWESGYGGAQIASWVKPAHIKKNINF